MQRVAVTSWRNFAELLEVKRDLYSSSGSAEPSHDHDTLQKQRRAVYLISAWAMRGRIPHAVHSTGLLLEALFNHQNPHSSSFNIQAVYATAFSRFVTGFCDMSMANKVRQNMHSAAANIGMPAEWVDIRHEIAHGNQPRTVTLEIATKEALAWLWANFWTKLDTSDEPEGLADPRGMSTRFKTLKKKILTLEELQVDMRERANEIENNTHQPSITLDDLRTFLLKFVEKRMNEISARSQVQHEDSATSNAAYEIINLCLDIPARLDRLAFELVQPRLMIPVERSTGDSMEGAFMIWKPLISTLRKYQYNFIGVLLTRMVAILAEPESLSSWSNAALEATYEWILTLVTSFRTSRSGLSNRGSVKDPDREYSKAVVAKQCTLSPTTFWTEKLFLIITEQGSDAFKRRWQRYARY